MKKATLFTVALFSLGVLAHGPHSHVKCFTGKTTKEAQEKVNQFAGGHDHFTAFLAEENEPTHRGILIDAMTKDTSSGEAEICIAYKHSH